MFDLVDFFLYAMGFILPEGATEAEVLLLDARLVKTNRKYVIKYEYPLFHDRSSESVLDHFHIKFHDKSVFVH